MPTINYEATLKLDFLVVGGGISGFSVAYVLSKAGHRVRVLEKLPDLGSPAGGLRVPPNLSKIFREWIGVEELRRMSARNVGTPWYDMETGEKVGYHHWTPAVMQETGGEFLMMHHEDVHRMLYRLATSAGAKIDFGVTVTSVEGTDPKPQVTLSTGEVLTADLVIGADGPTSIVRQTAFEMEDDAQPTGISVLGGVIPIDAMLQDPLLAGLAKADEWPIFMGPNRSLCCHPVRAKKEFAVQVYWPDEEVGGVDGKESWYEIIPTSRLKFDTYGQNVQRLMQLVPQLSRTRWMTRKEELEDWTDDSGRVVLVGEAAHPWFPGGSHPTSMVVEDAVVLGTLFSHLDSENQIGAFLNAYQEIRAARCKVVKEQDISNAALVRLPPGPDRDKRNANMAPEDRSANWNEGVLKSELEMFSEVFSYEAADAAEEWWVDWGRFSQNANERSSHQSMDFLANAAVTVAELESE